MADEPRYDLPCLDLPVELGGVTEREALLIKALLDALGTRGGDYHGAMWPLSLEIERDLARAKAEAEERREAAACLQFVVDRVED